MERPSQLQGLDEYLPIGQAAAFLRVTHWTLRNWDKAGKFWRTRRPMSAYRLCRHEDLETILNGAADKVGQAGSAKQDETP